MPVKTIERASELACYLCGSTDVFSLCHQCARPMCGKHSPFAFRSAGKFDRKPGSSGKSASAEYGGLKLDAVQAAVYHCEDHSHSVGMNRRLLFFGSVLVVVGLALLSVAGAAAILILLIGGAAAGYALLRWWRGRAAMAAAPPPLPLFPHIRTARVVERVNGRIDLTEEGYRSRALGITGAVSFSMTHSDWQERRRRYRKRYRVTEDAPGGFNAGFAMLEGPAGLAFDPRQPLVLEAGGGLWFRGNSAGHDLFEAAQGRHEGEWKPEVTYQLRKGRKPESIPLWIVPSLVPSSDQRTLEIDLHWTPLGEDHEDHGSTIETSLRDGDGPRIDLCDLIRLTVPTEWGNMETASPGNAETTAPTPGEPYRTIEWHQVAPVDDNEYVQLKERDSRALVIRFEKRITPGSKLSGRIEATFKGTLSGVTGVRLYHPGGGRAEHLSISSAETKVAVDFTIDLGTIRYQEDRVVPDENHLNDRNRNKASEFSGVVPNADVILKLTDSISEDDYYVKSVIEHRPMRDHGQDRALSHVWDIAGRFYTGVYPIDFHINVSGKELQGAAGTTTVQVSVKGAYVTGGNADGKLLEGIEEKWEDLHRKVERVFRDAAALAYEGQTAGDVLFEPRAIDPSPVIEPPAIERGATYEPPAIESASAPEPALNLPARDSQSNQEPRDKAERVADLWQQWEIADERVLTERISEGIYKAILIRIKRQLRDLGEDPESRP